MLLSLCCCLRSDYAQIRGMLHEAKPLIQTPEHLPVMEAKSPQNRIPCTYYRHIYQQEAAYRLSNNTAFMYWLLCALVSMLLCTLFLSAAIGLSLSNKAAVYCALTFTGLLLFHMFVLDPLKVLFITALSVRHFKRLP